MPARSRLSAVVVLLGCASVLRATPASAHAVLLRAEPSPQTTVERPPAAIRLTFSEPVEVAFGAVRVFDVDGDRVDSGSIRRAEGNRQVLLPVVGLGNGTYTVTWRVTSEDGHTVRGGFGFFVGAPSSISAVAVAADEGSGPVVAIGYGVARFMWFGSLILVLGTAAMRRWVWTPALRAAGLAASPAARHFRRRSRTVLAGAEVALVAAGVLVLGFQSATVSGLPLGSALRPEVLGELLQTTFGRLWLVQMALAVALAVPVAALVTRRPWGGSPRIWLVAAGVVGSALCVATAANGHARTVWEAAVMVPALGLHLMAAAVWAGGLAALVLLGSRAWRSVGDEQRRPLVRDLIGRFGRVGRVAVAVLAATGVVTSVGLLGRVPDLWEVPFGRIVSAKVALLVGAVALAAVHRRPRGLIRFSRTGPAELAAVVGAVALASVLVSLVPGRSLALAAKGPVNQERRAGPYTVQLYVDPTRPGENELHLTFVNQAGLAAAEVATVEVGLGPAGGELQPVTMRLISPGHFVGDATLPAPGRYSLAVASPGAAGAATTFDFRLHQERST